MQRHLRFLTFVLLCSACTASAQDVGDAVPNANGSIRLGGGSSHLLAPMDEVTFDESLAQQSEEPALELTTAQPADADSTAIDADIEAGGTAVSSPQRDTRPLGSPNGLFSSRPVEATAADTEQESGWMGSLDPRQNDFVRVLGALAIVIGLLLFARVLLRKAPGLTGGFRPSGVVEVLARYPVGRGQQLIILKLARRVILLHHAGNTMTPLTEIEDPAEVAALLTRMESGASGRGKAVFNSVLGKYKDEHKRLMTARSGKNQYWSDDLNSGEVVDLTQRTNGKTRALSGDGTQSIPEIVTKRRAARRGLARR